MVVGGTDLDEPLKEQLRLAAFPFPEILQDLVGLEEVLLVEQPDALLDGIQAWEGIGSGHRERDRRGSNQLFRGERLTLCGPRPARFLRPSSWSTCSRSARRGPE